MDYKLSLEYREVALRAEHVAASGLSRDAILIIIMGLEKAAEPVPTFMQARPLSSDPDDDMILDLAICGKASAIVTQNTKHFRIASRDFGIAVLTPAELLEYLEEKRYEASAKAGHVPASAYAVGATNSGSLLAKRGRFPESVHPYCSSGKSRTHGA